MCEFEKDIHKCPTFPAPLRERLFQPREPPLTRPIVPRFLIPRRSTDHAAPPKPVIGPDGKEYFRLSDVKMQLEREMRQAEQGIRDEFVRKLTAYLSERLQPGATDEDDRIVFGCEGDVQCGIALVFSIDQGLSIVNDHGHVSLDMDMLGLRTHQEWYGCDEDCSLTVERRGDSVLFLSAGRQLYSFTFPSIASSVSISFFCRGCGQVTFSFS